MFSKHYLGLHAPVFHQDNFQNISQVPAELALVEVLMYNANLFMHAFACIIGYLQHGDL